MTETDNGDVGITMIVGDRVTAAVVTVQPPGMPPCEFTGEAIRHENDTHDPSIGWRLALGRALTKAAEAMTLSADLASFAADDPTVSEMAEWLDEHGLEMQFDLVSRPT